MRLYDAKKSLHSEGSNGRRSGKATRTGPVCSPSGMAKTNVQLDEIYSQLGDTPSAGPRGRCQDGLGREDSPS